MAPRIVFVLNQTQPGKSTKERERLDAEVRSHAATISHARRIKAKQNQRIRRDNRKPVQVLALESVPYPGFGGFRYELYQNVPHKNMPENLVVLDFYSQIMTPSLDLAAEVFNVTNVFSYFLDVMSLSPFYSAGASTLRFMFERLQDPLAPPSEHLLHQRGVAMVELMQRLKLSKEPQNDDLLLVTMIFHAVLEISLARSSSSF
jgi:hypothetical protein